jgi:hypothetical protein
MKSTSERKAGAGLAAAHGSTRRELMTWAIGNVSTAHLRRLKSEGKNICQLIAELRSEKFSADFALERLQKDHEGLRGGHKRWREEAVMLHRVREILEAFINKEMKMTAKDPRLKRLARQIAKVSNS